MIYVVLILTIGLVVSVFFNFWNIFRGLAQLSKPNKLEETLSQSEQEDMRAWHDSNFRGDKIQKDEEGEAVEVKVALYNGKAYWIDDDGLRTAPVDEDEEVLYEDQKPVDAVSMSRREAETIMEIIDALRSE
jgi:hypothetical protein